MNKLTLNDYIDFFKSLSLKEKIVFISRLTNILSDDVSTVSTKDTDSSEKDQLLDELFGAWADEDGLNEETIIHRIISERDINLDD